MKIKQAFKLAMKSLKGSKMRSFLTMLGIIIGVASVILLVNIVSGMKSSVVNTFESMGTNLITVTITGRGGNRTVTPEQMQKLAEENNDVIGYMSPTINIMNATAKYGNTNLTTTCTGINEYYKDIKDMDVEKGRFISYIDLDTRQRNCVIGTFVAKELFEGEDPLGKIIKINSDNFKIIGVLPEKQGNQEGSSDDVILIPYTVAQRISMNYTVGSYNFSALNNETVDEAMNVISNFLLEVFSDSSAYRILNMADILKQIKEIIDMMTLVLVGIAGISLFVGGIGIMNIMLVSVTERTREIGIRKSLGATPWDIMSQFVVEAITTSAIGGVLGIILGLATSYGATFIGLEITISYIAIIISFSVSAAIGITFGYFPAKKASKLNPIDALRYD